MDIKFDGLLKIGLVAGVVIGIVVFLVIWGLVSLFSAHVQVIWH